MPQQRPSAAKRKIQNPSRLNLWGYQVVISEKKTTIEKENRKSHYEEEQMAQTKEMLPVDI